MINRKSIVNSPDDRLRQFNRMPIPTLCRCKGGGVLCKGVCVCVADSILCVLKREVVDRQLACALRGLALILSGLWGIVLTGVKNCSVRAFALFPPLFLLHNTVALKHHCVLELIGFLLITGCTAVLSSSHDCSVLKGTVVS